MITREEILKGQQIDPSLESNLSNLLIALNKFRTAYGQPMRVTSGFRDPEHNAKIGGAKNSLHLSCQAADFADADGKIKLFCLQNIKVLEECGLWMENPAATKNWCHLDIKSRKNRIFKP